MDTVVSASNDLVSSLEGKSRNQKSSQTIGSTGNKKQNADHRGWLPSLPTTLEVYQIGCHMQRLAASESSSSSSSNDHALNEEREKQSRLIRQSYQQLLQVLPQSYTSKILNEIFQTLQTILTNNNEDNNNSSNSKDDEEATVAIEVVSQLYVSAMMVEESVPRGIQCHNNDSNNGNHNNNDNSKRRRRRNIAAENTVWTEEQARQLVVTTTTTVSSSTTQTVNGRRRKDAVIGILSNLMWWSSPEREGTQEAPAVQQEQQQLETVLAVIHCLQENGLWNTLVRYEESRLGPNWKEIVLERYSDPSQRDYLESFLDYHDNVEVDDKPAKLLAPDGPSQGKQSKNHRLPQRPAKDELTRRIEQVQQVLPELGGGFVEAALAHYGGDVERTVAALFDEDQLPATLQVLDRSLPRRRKEMKDSNNILHNNEDEDDIEARQIAKAIILENERKQREEASALEYVIRQHNDTDDNMNPNHDASDRANNNHHALFGDEYNDDYDDQYDELDAIGDADNALYDKEDDYRAIRTYNRLVKEEEAEQRFWSENQNLNRPARGRNANASNGDGDGDNDSDDDDDGNDDGNKGRRFRNPDKMRGGRIPNQRNAGRGGKKGGGDGDGGGNSESGAASGGDGGRGGAGGRGRGRGGRGRQGGGGRTTFSARGQSSQSGRGGGVGGEQSTGRGGGSGGGEAQTSNNHNSRRKTNKIANRREKQKQAMAKRSGI